MKASEKEELSLLVSTQFEVNASHSQFFEWFADFRNYPAVFPHVVSIEPVDEVPVGTPGKKYAETATNFLGRPEKIDVTLLGFERNKEIWVEAHNPRVKSVFRFGFVSKDENSSLLEWGFYTRYKNPMILFLLKLVLKQMFGKRFQETAKRLKNLNLEG